MLRIPQTITFALMPYVSRARRKPASTASTTRVSFNPRRVCSMGA
jgi:hypothetical protein